MNIFIKHSQLMIFFLLFLFMRNSIAFTQTDNKPNIHYFGQKPPGKKAVVFAPDFISREGWWVEGGCFSHDGKEFVFTMTDESWNYKAIMYTKYNGENWTEPDTLIKNVFAPYFSHDDKILYFIKYKQPGSETADIWMSTRGNTNWNKPVKMEFPVNLDNADEFEVCENGKGQLYIASNRPGGIGEMDIYSVIKENGQYKIENLGQPVNTKWIDVCPFISSDDSYMVFDSWRPNAEFKGNNLYITFRDTEGLWTNPTDLGSFVNTDYLDIYPYVSPDEKYLLFTIRTTCCDDGKPSSKIYWISTQIFDSLKPGK